MVERRYSKSLLRLLKLMSTDDAFIKRIVLDDSYTLFYWQGDKLKQEEVSPVVIEENDRFFDYQHFYHFTPPQSKLTLNERGHAVLAANTAK